MAQLVVWDIISLDGYFEGDQPWDLRLHEHLWGEDLRQLSLEIGEEAELLVFGRRTYEGMASHWPHDTTEPEIARYMNEIPKLVASRTITSSSWNNTVVTADIMTELSQRKASTNGPIYVFGSAELVDGLLDAGLVDDPLVEPGDQAAGADALAGRWAAAARRGVAAACRAGCAAARRVGCAAAFRAG